MLRSIATVSLGGTLMEKLNAIAAAGFDGVEIFENDLLYFDGSPRDAKRIAADLGLRILLFQPFRDFEAAPRARMAKNFDRAELPHHVELRLGPIEVLRHARARRRLEVAERLEQQDAQAEIGRDAPHFGGRAVEIHQVVLEDLDAVEPRGRDRGKLFHQRAAERDRSDGAKHFGWPYKNEFVGDS